MRALVAVLLLLTLAFAGCASKGNGDGGEGSDSSTDSTSSSASTTASGSKSGSSSSTGSTTQTGTASPANRPPTGTVTAAANGTAVTFTLNGTDPDGDALSWTLSFSDGVANATGTSLPANATHTYPAAGDVSATFTLSDGRLNASYGVNITLSAPGAGGDPVVHSGSVTVPDPWAATLDGCLMDAGRRDAGGPGGITGQDHPIEATQWGWSYALDNPGLIAEYWSSGAILGAGNAGTVPPEATYVVVCIKDPSVAPADYQLTLSPA